MLQMPGQRKFVLLLAAIAVVLLVNILLESLNTATSPVVEKPIIPMGLIVLTPAPTLYQYIEVIDSCGPYYGGTCVVARSGPGEKYRAVMRLRTGMVLKVGDAVEREGRTWYKIVFDEGLLYPERLTRSWYVAADHVRPFTDEGPENVVKNNYASTTKFIIVDRAKETLYAYEGDTLFMHVRISTGLKTTPTPRGTFTVYKKTPSRYMQGPLPGVSDQYYDLPGVPWDLYFTAQGAAIHGAYWHDKFGKRWSHGCVNLPLDEAHKLYEWADVGTPVIVQD